MLNREIPVSAEYALLIADATAGAVPANETRPDLPWPSPSTQPNQHGHDDQNQHGDDSPAADTVEAAE
jgi:DNA-binding transcriptional regulator YdaS (Cro superfamily)